MERSQTQQYLDEAEAVTNQNLDDAATRAAPFTLASKLDVSSDEEECDDEK